MSTPAELSHGGQSLWDAITADHELDATQLAQLLEACRAKDRLDDLDALVRDRGEHWERHLMQANALGTTFRQLLAALRLPDEDGKRPRMNRTGRGSYDKSGKAGVVTALDRARAKAGA